MKVLILFPSVGESKYFKRDDVAVHIVGEGLVSSGYQTLKAIQKYQPDVVVMGGIAGVYYGSKFGIGDCVVVSEEIEADLGFFYPDGFKHYTEMPAIDDFFKNKRLLCEDIPADFPLERAVSNTLNAAMAPFVKIEGVDVENMEGSAFFKVCIEENVKFFEVRSISNSVDVSHADWDIDKSFRVLADGLNKVVDYIIK